MALIKRSEWPLVSGSWLTDFFDTDRFFDSDLLKYQSMPAVNVKESEGAYEIEVAAPGLTKKDFNITVDNRVLTIASEKEEKTEEKENNYTRREFSYTSFTRSFTLPENVKEEDVKANYEDGILKLSVPKKTITQPKLRKAIEVK
ncbi:MAG TPA: Hsp20/alpha crystallin family protein [Cyclobacteriaceae bacterium]|nr:Hsp20/alpha crystallin family protein [Cyclobacteriaceae bacterium]